MSDSGRGQQRVRTRLAWLRTALLAAVISLLAARLAIGHRLTVRGLLGVIVATVLWLTVVAICHRRISALSSPRPVTASRAPAVLAAVAVGYAVLGGLIVGLRSG